jgi:hypothetical protein
MGVNLIIPYPSTPDACVSLWLWLQTLKFRAAAFTGGHKMSHHNGMLKEGVDVAVCTPGRLQQLLEASLISMDLCQVHIICLFNCPCAVLQWRSFVVVFIAYMLGTEQC